MKRKVLRSIPIAAVLLLILAARTWADQGAGGIVAPESWSEKFQKAMGDLLNPWVLFGFGAQFCFMMRFVVQWISSERRKRSHVPVAFWYLSLAGGLMLFTYAVHRADPVFILGQGLGCFIYVRNLMLIHRRGWAKAELLNSRSRKQRQEDSAGQTRDTESDVPDQAASTIKRS